MRKVDSMTECGRADLSKFVQSMSLMFGARVRGCLVGSCVRFYRVWCRNIIDYRVLLLHCIGKIAVC